MIIASKNIKSAITSPVRKITARVELYEGSTLVDVFSYDDKLIDFTVERVCEESKFFGFGICQHAKVQILDINREVNYITTSHTMRIAYGVNGEYIYTHPTFHITQSRRDENTNELAIYGYDLIYPSAAHQVSELNIRAPYTLNQYAVNIATFLNTTLEFQGIGATETNLSTDYPTGANFDGAESVREALNYVAEATQTIYFVNSEDRLVFKRLDKDAVADSAITKADYITLETKDGKRLGTIVSATELGDNYSASTSTTGSTQYVRENPFWDIREDVATLVENAIAAVGGLTVCQFDCSWRGNFLLEPGDKIELTTKDNEKVITYLLDDVITYNGTLTENTKWAYSDEDAEASNSTSLGDVLKQTYAKVDKANKQIELLVSETQALNESMAILKLDTDSINASVKQTQSNTQNSIDTINANMETLTKQVNATMSAEDVKLEIKTEIENNGASKITTTTGFTFNEEGMTISKSGSEMTTLINEDGMRVFRDEEEVLTADNIGVKATNLHATTYLIVGTTSRFEDYLDGTRTGCFFLKE
jgi:hypothetical protein